MHVNVRTFMAKFLLAFHDHSRPFTTIHNHLAYTAPHGPVRVRCLSSGIRVPPGATSCRTSLAQHSILEQKCKENM
jgi:hypothetical protein